MAAANLSVLFGFGRNKNDVIIEADGSDMESHQLHNSDVDLSTLNDLGLVSDDSGSSNVTDRSSTIMVAAGNGSQISLAQILSSSGQVRIPLYAAILVLAVTGNVLVIVTLAQNRAMRTVTNLFLLNLSVSDLLLAVICMPFTLIPTLLKDFIFGAAMCVLIRYMQGVSVGVSVFTLVTISMERYFAICRPLTSLRWQTRRHAYKTIGLVWTVAVVTMIPTAVKQKLLRMPTGGHKCAEIWEDHYLEKIYNIFLDVILLVLPLLMMVVAYGRIAITLFRGFRRLNGNKRRARQMSRNIISANGSHATGSDDIATTASGTSSSPMKRQQHSSMSNRRSLMMPSRISRFRTSDCPNPGSGSRVDDISMSLSASAASGADVSCSNSASRMRAKKRSVQMLSAVVIEFFVCWTPMYVMQTWLVFDYFSAVRNVSSATMNYIHLVAFVSSCCNPITYCFMSHKFRQGFLAAFRCCFCCCASRSAASGRGGPGQSGFHQPSTWSRAATVGAAAAGRNCSIRPNDRGLYEGMPTLDNSRLGPDGSTLRADGDASGSLIETVDVGRNAVAAYEGNSGHRRCRPTSASTTGNRRSNTMNCSSGGGGLSVEMRPY